MENDDKDSYVLVGIKNGKNSYELNKLGIIFQTILLHLIVEYVRDGRDFSSWGSGQNLINAFIPDEKERKELTEGQEEILDMLAKGEVDAFDIGRITFYYGYRQDSLGHPTKHRNFRVIEGGKK